MDSWFRFALAERQLGKACPMLVDQHLNKRWTKFNQILGHKSPNVALLVPTNVKSDKFHSIWLHSNSVDIRTNTEVKALPNQFAVIAHHNECVTKCSLHYLFTDIPTTVLPTTTLLSTFVSTQTGMFC